MDLPASHEPVSAPPAKRRTRASQACSTCRARKVRCDYLQRQPCSNCAIGKKICRAPTPFQNRSLRLHSPQSPTQILPPNPTVHPETANQHGQGEERPVVPSPIQDRPTSAGERRGTAIRSSPQHPISLQDGLTGPTIRGLVGVSPIQEGQRRTVDDNIWTRNLQTMTGANSVGLQSTISPSDTALTAASSAPPRKRMKFGGEALAHSILPHMDGHAELVVTTDHQGVKRVDRNDLMRPMGPKALRPYGQSPWVHADCQQHLDLLGHLPLEDRYYLFNVKKVYYFPQKSVGVTLLSTFFESVYPLLPIVDKLETSDLFEMLYQGQGSSPLLFHALMFVACQYVDEQELQRAGFSTISEAKIYFFRRAQLLYEFDCEPEHIIVIQSLIFLSYWWMDYTEEKDMRYWLSCAVNLALSMGMHKSIPKSLNMPPKKLRLWRRVFWTLLGREHNVAIALGQPFSLRLREGDIQPLCAEDFDEEEEAIGQVMRSRHYLAHSQLRCHIDVKLKHVELACRVEKFLYTLQDVRNPEEAVVAIESAHDLARRDSFLTPGMLSDGFSLEEPLTWTRHNVFVVFHLLNHERLVALYYRRYERALLGSKLRRSAGLNLEVFDPSTSTAVHLESKRQAARASIFASAHNAARMFHSVFQRDLLRFTPSFVTTSTFHTLLSLSEEITLTLEGSVEHNAAKVDFFHVLDAVGELRKYWSSASWSFSMYSSLAENDFLALKTHREKVMLSSSRPLSRYPSRVGSPRSMEGVDGLINLENEGFDFMVPLPDDMPFSIDSLTDWQAFGFDDHYNQR